MRRLNHGGWPYRPKTVFDPAARRTAMKAATILDSAKTHLRETVDGDLWDGTARVGDWATSAAMTLLDEAMSRVNQAETAANQAAKERM
jgi:hypothetical protein